MPKTNSPTVDALTASEKKAFINAEAVIRKSLASFIEVGNALREIRECKLYRAAFTTFEEYCQDRWNIGRNYANKQIAAADLVSQIGSNVYPPQNEAQCRELLEAGDDAPKVWKEVVRRALKLEDGSPVVSAKFIAEVRDAMLKPKPPAQPQAPKDEPPRKDKATDPAVSESPDAEPPVVVNGIGKHEDVEEPEAPVTREPGEDDDELPGDNLRADEWTGPKLNQVIAAIRYLEDKIVPAEATVVKRIGRLFPHNGLPLKRWNDELAAKARDLKIFRNKLQAMKAQQAGAAK